MEIYVKYEAQLLQLTGNTSSSSSSPRLTAGDFSARWVHSSNWGGKTLGGDLPGRSTRTVSFFEEIWMGEPMTVRVLELVHVEAPSM